MRLTSSSSLLALLSITALSDALPFALKPRNNRRIAQATYSVVAVDGGSSSVLAATQTIMDSTTLPPVTTTMMSTLLSTIVVTDSESPTTIVVTITEIPSPYPSPTTTTMTSEYTELNTYTTTEIPATQLYTSTTTATPSAVTSVTSQQAEQNTVTVTATPLTTWLPYDNGMWHTTYFHPAEYASAETGAPGPSNGAFAPKKREIVARQQSTTLGVLCWSCRTATYTVTPYYPELVTAAAASTTV